MDSPAAEDNDYTAAWLSTNQETPSGSICDIRDAHEAFASRFYDCCVANFRDFCQYKERQPDAEALKKTLWDELARLYMWGEYFKDGELDMALAPSEELASKVISLLSAIGKRLLRSSALIVSEPNGSTPGFMVTLELSSLIEQAEVIVSKTNGEDLLSANDWDDGDDSDSESTSIQEDAEFCEDVEFNTRCLMQLVPALEQNIVSSRKTQIPHNRPTSQTFSVSEPASTYIYLAQQRFQEADLKLVQRLGEANWQRHVRLRTKLYGHEDERNEPSAPVACSIFHDSGLGTTIPGPSQYAPSLASHASFASSVGKEESPFLRVPPMPPEVIAGQEFVCTLCGNSQSRIRNRVEWKMHVFSDLKPYICTFPECAFEFIQFSTRAQWADHEFSRHRFVEDWCCPLCSTRDIYHREDCEQHLEDSHGLLHEELAYWVDRARTRRARMMNMEECLLCRKYPAESRQAFIKHCCQHMEEIALMAMPQISDDGSEHDEDNSDQESSTRSSGHPVSTSSFNDADHELHEKDAPAIASAKHSDSALTDTHQHPSQESEDEHRPHIDPTPELPGGSQIEKMPQKVMSESATHKCSICGKCYKREYYYKQHMETCNSQRKYPHQCTATNGDQSCTKKFQRKTDLDRHYDSVHLKARNHRCSLCGNRFALRDTLRRHNEDGCPKRFRFGFRKTPLDGGGIAPDSQAALDPGNEGRSTYQEELAALDRQAPEIPKGNAIESSNINKQGLGPSSNLQIEDQPVLLGRCHSCNRRETPQWRRGPDGDRSLCNGCGLKYAKLTRILAQSNANHSSNMDKQGLGPSSSVQPEDQAARRGRCHSCNQAKTSKWRRGPDGDETLCNACGLQYTKLNQVAF